MKQLIILWMSVMLLRFTGARYPECNGVSCPDGSVPLSPLSYNTIRSNVFNGTQPSNEGCTNGVSIDGQMTIECGQGTTLIDCNRGFNGGDYSDLSRTFAWNRTSSVAEQVSIVFRFSQQVNISRIIMFFWNSPSNSIIIPNVRLYWSNDDSITPSNEINITPKSVKRIDDERRRWFIDIDDNGLQFQYLRIEMSFYDDSEWIFLSEVAFCGNTAPYHITQPSTDNEVQIVSPTATMATLTCSLNITIPSTVIVIWLHNGSVVMTTPPNGNTTTLQLENLQPSDAGVYQCVFNDTVGYVLRRSTNLLIIDPQIIQPPVNFITVFFNESTSFVQLTCSLNINIPSSVTVTWIYRGFLIIIEPPYEVITVDNNTTLVIHNPQPSDVGDYQCLFMGLYLQRRPVITLDIRCVIISAPANGEILSCSSGTVGVGSVGDTCSFACNTGYELIGSDTRTCQSNGSWTGTDIICSRVRCPSLTNPGNRIANCSLGDDGIFSYEDVCSFTCNAGYEPVDSTERACQSDGSWSGSPLSCTIMECPSLSLPMNSMLAESCSSTYQSMCELQCPEGFTGTGDSLYVCDVLSNGSSVMWMAKGNAWKCEKVFQNATSNSTSSFQNTTFITITSTSTATTTIIATSTIASSSHRFISHIDITIATYYHSVTTSTNSNVNLPTVSVVGRHTTYNYLPSTEPTVSASSNDNNNSSVGVIVATVVTLVLAVFIVIAVVVVGIIVVWKGKKREGHTKPEGIYYSTINETSLARSPTSKPEPVYSEMDDGQDDKEPQYMDITDKAHSTKQADKVAMQDNPAYSAASEHLVELQDNPAYCTSFKHHA